LNECTVERNERKKHAQKKSNTEKIKNKKKKIKKYIFDAHTLEKKY